MPRRRRAESTDAFGFLRLEPVFECGSLQAYNVRALHRGLNREFVIRSHSVCPSFGYRQGWIVSQPIRLTESRADEKPHRRIHHPPTQRPQSPPRSTHSSTGGSGSTPARTGRRETRGLGRRGRRPSILMQPPTLDTFRSPRRHPETNLKMQVRSSFRVLDHYFRTRVCAGKDTRSGGDGASPQIPDCHSVDGPRHFGDFGGWDSGRKSR